MAEIFIILKDAGNDVIEAKCTSEKVEAILHNKLPLGADATGAEQLAVIMCNAAHAYLRQISVKRGLKVQNALKLKLAN